MFLAGRSYKFSCFLNLGTSCSVAFAKIHSPTSSLMHGGPIQSSWMKVTLLARAKEYTKHLMPNAKVKVLSMSDKVQGSRIIDHGKLHPRTNFTVHKCPAFSLLFRTNLFLRYLAIHYFCFCG